MRLDPSVARRALRPRPPQRAVCARGPGPAVHVSAARAGLALATAHVSRRGRPCPAGSQRPLRCRGAWGQPRARPARPGQVCCQPVDTGRAVGRPRSGPGCCSCADFGLAAAVPPPEPPARLQRSLFPLVWVRRSFSGPLGAWGPGGWDSPRPSLHSVFSERLMN